MKIYFCDGCNESIPLTDVKSGQVTTIKGKLFCRSCIPPGALAGPPAVAPSRAPRTSRPLLALVVLVLVGWTAWRDRALWMGAPPAAPTVLDPSIQAQAEARRRLAQLEADLSALRDQTETQGRALAALAKTQEAAGAQGEARDKLLVTLGDNVQRLGISQSAASQLVERVQSNANRVATLELRVDALAEAMAMHEADRSWVDGEGGEPGAAQQGAELSAGDEGNMVDPVRAARLDELRRALLDPEPDRRFEGVDEIEIGNYRELAPDLLPLLQDEDMFVRLHSMNVLGNFGYEAAAPVLFDVLDDGNASIRKSAAETLVRLTGYDPGFEAKGSANERSRAVKKWREWYDKRGG